eukprot:Sro616_g175940.1 n/a (370) ;mRNA; r:22705-23814
MADEVIRRFHDLGLKKIPKPKNWKAQALKKWLIDNPIADETDIAWLMKQEEALFNAVKNQMNESDKQKEADAKTTNSPWKKKDDYLRMYIAAMHDKVRTALLKSGFTLTRMELDARNNEARPDLFFAALTDLYNDDDFIAKVEALPDLHEDFQLEYEINTLDVPAPASEDHIKRKWNDCKAKLAKIVSRFERSGTGDGHMAEQDNELAEGETELRSGQRSSYIHDHLGEQPHLLYLWHLADKYDVLNHVIVRLSEDVAATGDEVATDTAKTQRKRKGNSAGEDDSATEFRRDISMAQKEQAYQTMVESYQRANEKLLDYKLDYARVERSGYSMEAQLYQEQIKVQEEIAADLKKRISDWNKKPKAQQKK